MLDADPFVVNEETKTMMMQNIAFLLAQCLCCTVYENIVFCWVMDEQEIIDSIVDAVSYKEAVRIAAFSLVGSEKCLTKRLEKDVANGIRQPDIVARLCALKRQMEK